MILQIRHHGRTNVDVHVCLICRRAFDTAPNLRAHMKEEHPAV